MKAVIVWTLWSRRWSILWWSLGLAAFIGLELGVYNSIKGQSAQLNQALSHLPSSVRAEAVREEVLVKDNKDSIVLQGALEYVRVGDLSRAYRLIEQRADPKMQNKLREALSDKLMTTIVESLDGTDFINMDMARYYIEEYAMYNTKTHDELLSLTEPYYLQAIAYRLASEDPIDRNQALLYINSVPDGRLKAKIRELYGIDADENYVPPEKIVVPDVIDEAPTPPTDERIKFAKPVTAGVDAEDRVVPLSADEALRNALEEERSAYSAYETQKRIARKSNHSFSDKVGGLIPPPDVRQARKAWQKARERVERAKRWQQ